ncbi:hypothetical protein AMEX_G20519 [Astyanax mexicanus]|uniref:Transmembrane protein n=1 Tax=Astyanax mexicanus TaxID=7994 RepID=A0A8T2L385_ASTMX|nr:hypothetical protein AMEX_G20519 [Astyanax mexicanus]
MIEPYIIQPFINTHKERNIILIFVVICLILGEKFIEADFVCPCEKIYRGLFFWIYLLMPAFVAYVAVLCILKNMDKPGTPSRSSDMESGRSPVEPGIQPAECGRSDVESRRSRAEPAMQMAKLGTSNVESQRSLLELSIPSAERETAVVESQRSCVESGIQSAEHGTSDVESQRSLVEPSIPSAERGTADVESQRSCVESGIQPAEHVTADVESQRSLPEPSIPSAERGTSDVESQRSHEQHTHALGSRIHSDRRENVKMCTKLKAARNSAYGQSFMAVFIWIVLFFSDGRYVACIATTLSAEHAVSSNRALWEWCDTNRTLTANQNTAEKAYYISKLSGIASIFLLSVLALVYQCWSSCRRCCDATPDEPTGTVVETDDG